MATTKIPSVHSAIAAIYIVPRVITIHRDEPDYCTKFMNILNYTSAKVPKKCW